ncbi:hypothetical protein RN001_015962 [Aquatica leii]|uniref:Uncharacterized protein n=1 Tax=Aquatica leii TaxID=1421715 RepID=A0AAN7NZP4_9COLE|nr:hypothetical protein RN001_015962 [Aquatica leii]
MTELKNEFRDVNFKIITLEIDHDDEKVTNEDVTHDEFREMEEFDTKWYTVLSKMQSLVDKSNFDTVNHKPRTNQTQFNSCLCACVSHRLNRYGYLTFVIKLSGSSILFRHVSTTRNILFDKLAFVTLQRNSIST